MAGGDRRSADERLALELARGIPVAEAATAAGVSERTAYRRKHAPEFRDKLRMARGELFQCATGRLADAMGDAATALLTLLSAQSESIRLRAAVAVLDAAVRLRDSEDLADRVDILEEWAKELAKTEG